MGIMALLELCQRGNLCTNSSVAPVTSQVFPDEADAIDAIATHQVLLSTLLHASHAEHIQGDHALWKIFPPSPSYHCPPI